MMTKNRIMWPDKLQKDLTKLRLVAWPGDGSGSRIVSDFLTRWEQTIWEFADKAKKEVVCP